LFEPQSAPRLTQLLQNSGRLFAFKHSASHALWDLLGGLGVQLVAFLKLTLDAGKKNSHAGGDNGGRWLGYDANVAAGFKDKPKQ
jgi:hypothetical protein